MRSLLMAIFAVLSCSCATDSIILSPNQTVRGIGQNELVRLAVEQQFSSEADNSGSCGYEMAAGIWKLAMFAGKMKHEVIQCAVPANRYLLVSLTNMTLTIMNPKKSCDAALQEALKSLQEYKDPSFAADNHSVPRIAEYLQETGKCPDPFKYRDGIHKPARPKHPEEYPAGAAGYYVALEPLPHGKHELEFSVSNECWPDQRDHQTGACPKAGERRTVVIQLFVN